MVDEYTKIKKLEKENRKLKNQIERMEEEMEYLRNLSNTADQLKELLKDMIFEERCK